MRWLKKTLLGLKSSWYFPHCKDLLQGPKLWGWYCAHVLVFRKASSNMSVCLYLVIWNLFHQRVRKVPIIFTSRLPTSDGPKSYTRPQTALRNSSDTLSESPCNAKHNQTPTHNSLRPSTSNWNVTPPKPPLGVSGDVWGQLLVPIGHICCPELSGNIWKGSLRAYDSVADVPESWVWLRADFQRGPVWSEKVGAGPVVGRDGY